VFGLTCVVWNQDSQDWQLSEPGTKYTPASVNKSLVGWITGPKSPGLVILEHELSNMSVQAFINVYPLMKSQGWDTRAIPDTFGTSYYLNAVNSTTDVTQAMDVAQAGVASLPSTIGSSPSSVDGPPQSTGSKMSSPSAPVNAEKNKNSAPSRSASPLLLLIPGLIALVVSLIQ
jgi:chitin deacetylase